MLLGDILSRFYDDGSAATSQMIAESLGTDYSKPNKISSIFKKLSKYGMSYEDDVYRNMKAVPADKLLIPKDDLALARIYGTLGTTLKNKAEEEKPFNEKTLVQRRDILRKMAGAPELEDILDIMSNECIVYDDDNVYICKPYLDNAVLQDLNENILDEVRTTVDTIFYKMYLLADWKNQAWNIFRRWLVDGDIAFEIVYDDLSNPRNIIGLVDIDPATLTKVVEHGVTYWIQYKGVIGYERRLYDTQVIYIKYEDSGVIDRQSYLERLIRPFNIYRIIEQAQLIWTVTQSSFKTIFTIPVNGMGRAKGLQTLSSAMNRYKEDITFNAETGELKVNGKMNMPFNKEYWMPENENGKPEIETLADQGPDLANSEQMKYYEQKLYKASKIPSSRFDREMAATWFGTDPSQALRDEINFGRFTERLRSTFAQILVKPIKIQLALQMPELKDDKRILEAIGVRFNSYNQFMELMEEQVDLTRLEHIQSLKDTFVETDAEGNEKHFFCDRFLIVKYLKMSDADLELNEKYKLEDELKKKKEGEGDEEGSEEDENELGDELGLGGEDEEGNEEGGSEEGAEEEGGNDIDKEMMGDVKPEEGEEK